MPYIKKDQRIKFDEYAKKISENASNPGDLNYSITVILQEYLKKTGVRYANINEIIGVLECAKLEFYRRIAQDYENYCVEKNGDVLLVEIPKPEPKGLVL